MVAALERVHRAEKTISFAGLFSARVCATHFEKVVVVEPDAWTFTDEAVYGAPISTRVVEDSVHGAYQTLAHKRGRVYQYASVHRESDASRSVHRLTRPLSLSGDLDSLPPCRLPQLRQLGSEGRGPVSDLRPRASWL